MIEIIVDQEKLQKILIFNESDNLCPLCGYPMKEDTSCKSCNIIKKLAKESKIDYLKEIYPYPFKRIICVGEYYERGAQVSKDSKYLLSLALLHYKNDPANLKFFSDLLKDTIENFLNKSKISKSEVLLCCVPDHNSRTHQKSDLLSKDLAIKLNINYISALIKTENVLPQHNSKKIEERYIKVHGNYILDKSFEGSIRGKTILLIDDIVSTMASVNECSKILNQAKPKEIYIFGVGRKILPNQEKVKK